jgi:glycosyltransferase involved in cell wall biosynthesis
VAQPDLVHVHYALHGLSVLPLLFFHPLVVTVMGGDILAEQDFRGIHAVLGKLLLDRADLITTKSAFMEQVLAQHGDYQTRIRRVTWGVDLKAFRPDLDVTKLRAQWNIPPGSLVFFDPRLAQPLYNKHLILTAFARYLAAQRSAAVLLIAEPFGKPDYLSGLKALAATLGITDCVRFVGTIDARDMPYYYAVADVTISVPSSDGLPHTIYEALASGSFLILGNLPQYQGIIEDEVTGRLVPVGDEVALSSALGWVSVHPEVRARAKEVGRAYVERYADREVQEKIVLQLYAELLKDDR